ncbi:hypothetical protein FZD47_25595 [Bacillus infantis]|uniref:Uncharacterized protein n=1 Tax=Bacillus infantis TaxID=324767 RepID=A0A5D4RZK0_9BACI|nr:hypothetical protein [Bacillus infantis]TYS55801.1 hypothetical protein FZD47_25595 [Bacillus infantis]
MNVVIEISYIGYHSKITRSGSFKVNSYKFSMDPIQEAARAALGFIKFIQNDSYISYIEEVIYNGTEDITETVKKLIEAPPAAGPYDYL